uniref:Uncharacterized protein n=1 Tax=Anguilla anguilla TaxID=7936 RepID=A0A0E9S460_ANGAN
MFYLENIILCNLTDATGSHKLHLAGGCGTHSLQSIKLLNKNMGRG